MAMLVDDALPMLIVYKDKTAVHTAVRVQDEMKQGFDVDDVEEYLSAYVFLEWSLVLILRNDIINTSEAVNKYGDGTF
jgi:hypothetical protein